MSHFSIGADEPQLRVSLLPLINPAAGARGGGGGALSVSQGWRKPSAGWAPPAHERRSRAHPSTVMSSCSVSVAPGSRASHPHLGRWPSLALLTQVNPLSCASSGFRSSCVAARRGRRGFVREGRGTERAPPPAPPEGTCPRPGRPPASSRWRPRSPRCRPPRAAAAARPALQGSQLGAQTLQWPRPAPRAPGPLCAPAGRRGSGGPCAATGAQSLPKGGGGGREEHLHA